MGVCFVFESGVMIVQKKLKRHKKVSSCYQVTLEIAFVAAHAIGMVFGFIYVHDNPDVLISLVLMAISPILMIVSSVLIKNMR